MSVGQIHVAVTTDEHYLQHAGVMLTSLFVHNPQERFVVYVVSNALEHPDYGKLKKVVADAGHRFQGVTIDTRLLQHLKLTAHATTAVYYRLLIPAVMDASITKVLYLDCDLIVKDGVLPLWETPLLDHPVAAVEEPHYIKQLSLGMPANAPYFNSGVMLINLPAWRRENVSERALVFLQQYPDKIEAWDQDALNVVLQGNWLPLPARWNQQLGHFAAGEVLPELMAEWQECRQRPAVIHFSSKFKPWHAWCSHHLREEYYHYLRLTPWNKFKPAGTSNGHVLKQAFNKIIHAIAGKIKLETHQS